MFDKKFNIILGVFAILFISVSYMAISKNRLPFLSRASNKTLDISKTVVIISKLEALADGTDSSTISVFARNDKSVGIEGRQVNISTSLGQLNSFSSLSDAYGKTEFTLTSAEPGTAQLTITVDNLPVSSTYSVNFVKN